MKALLNQFFKVGRWLLLAIGVSLLVVHFVAPVKAAEPERVNLYNPTLGRISSGVSIPANQAYYWSSGTVPPVTNPSAQPRTRDYFGDTRTQATGIFQRFETLLEEAGLSLADAIYVRAYLVADPALDNQVDYAGWNAAYDQFFNTEKTPAVARSTVAVAGLTDPGWLVELEIFAVYPK